MIEELKDRLKRKPINRLLPVPKRACLRGWVSCPVAASEHGPRGFEIRDYPCMHGKGVPTAHVRRQLECRCAPSGGAGRIRAYWGALQEDSRCDCFALEAQAAVAVAVPTWMGIDSCSP